jgi:hypothetical protein
MMKKIIGVFLVVAMLFVVAGCGNDEADMSTESVDVNVEEGENNWCSEGSKFSVKGSEGEVSMVVVGVETTGKYVGYCHMRYEFDSLENGGSMDYYFNENGDGFQVIDVDGEKMEMVWKK